MTTDWIVHTDGASRGNPGPSAYSYVITRAGEEPIEYGEKIPNTTNNQAEYTALVEALRKVVELGAKGKVCIHSDSELMVKQMRREYKVKDPGLRELFDEAQELVAQLTGGVTFTHVLRGKNKRADELCNLVLDGKWKPDVSERRPLLPAGTMPTTAGAAAVAVPPAAVDKEAITLLRRAMLREEDGLPAYSAEEIWTSLRALLAIHGITVNSH